MCNHVIKHGLPTRVTLFRESNELIPLWRSSDGEGHLPFNITFRYLIMQTTKDIQESESYKKHLLKLKNASEKTPASASAACRDVVKLVKVKLEPGIENDNSQNLALSGLKKTEEAPLRIKQEYGTDEAQKPVAKQGRDRYFREGDALPPARNTGSSSRTWSTPYHHSSPGPQHRHSAPTRYVPGVLFPVIQRTHWLPEPRRPARLHSRPQHMHPPLGPGMVRPQNARHPGPPRISSPPKAGVPWHSASPLLPSPHPSLAFSQPWPKMSPRKPSPPRQKMPLDQPSDSHSQPQATEKKVKVEADSILGKDGTSAYFEHIAKLKACKMTAKNETSDQQVVKSETKTAVNGAKSSPSPEPTADPEAYEKPSSKVSTTNTSAANTTQNEQAKEKTASGVTQCLPKPNVFVGAKRTIASTDYLPMTSLRVSQNEFSSQPTGTAYKSTRDNSMQGRSHVDLGNRISSTSDVGSYHFDHTPDGGAQDPDQPESPACNFMDGFITLDSTYEAPDQAQEIREDSITRPVPRRRASDFFEASNPKNPEAFNPDSAGPSRVLKSVLKTNSRPRKRHLSSDFEDSYRVYDERNLEEPAIKHGSGERARDRNHEASGMRFKPAIPSCEKNALKVCLPKPSFSKRDVIAQMSLDSATAAGLEHLHPVSGYQCVLCQTFYLDYPTALHHCTLLSHKMKVMQEISESERERREDLDRQVEMV